MPLAATGDLIGRAAAERSAVAAFNVITLEHVEAVVAGAESVRRPVLLQVSENAVQYRYGRLLPLARAAVAAAEAAAVPVALHLDHVRSDSLLRQAADAGFSSVMYDAARLPYAENLAATRAATDWAHSQGSTSPPVPRRSTRAATSPPGGGQAMVRTVATLIEVVARTAPVAPPPATP